jgi:hypothetical protein
MLLAPSGSEANGEDDVVVLPLELAAPPDQRQRVMRRHSMDEMGASAPILSGSSARRRSTSTSADVRDFVGSRRSSTDRMHSALDDALAAMTQIGSHHEELHLQRMAAQTPSTDDPDGQGRRRSSGGGSMLMYQLRRARAAQAAKREVCDCHKVLCVCGW